MAPLRRRAAYAACLILLFLPGRASHGARRDTRPAEPILHLDLPGDIRLGALFPIHKQGESHKAPCGKIQKEDGIQPLEAMLFTLDQINRNPHILPGIQLGVKAYDSCDDPYYAAERALELLRGYIARETDLGGAACPDSAEDCWPGGSNVVGLVGPQTSPVAVQIATMGRLFHVPQVSYLSTSVALCNVDEYSYFFRTVPSDVHQAKAIVELLRTFGWQYASIVHSDTDYGETGYEALAKLMEYETAQGRDSICLADPITIYHKHFTRDDYKDVVDRLLRNTLSRVVIVFADRVPAGKLLEAAKEKNARDKFVWIGSDAWASRESVVKGREEIVEGAIAVQPLRRELPGYNEYFRRLVEDKERHAKKNPWFDEYYRCYHDCQSCGEDCSRPMEFRQLYIHFVRDAVYALAYALHNLHREACAGPSVCPEFRRRVFTDLKHYLRHVSFQDVANNTFQFYDHNSTAGNGHDGPPRYSIITFKQQADGAYDWQNVGTFTEGQIELDRDFRVNFSSNKTFHFCQREECSSIQIKVQNTADQCCWHCVDCTQYQSKVSEYECQACPPGTMSNALRSGCDLIDETYLSYTNSWAISALVVAGVGVFLTLVAGYVLWSHWDTPVVKACGRELSLLLLLGTFLSFTVTFFIVAKPSRANCGVMRFGIGFCYTICYSAIITKTNRVARIFTSQQLNPRFTSPLSCLVIAGGLVSVEVLILAVWLVSEPPSVEHIVHIPGKRVLVCSGVDNSFITGLVYPFILILGATLYAFQTRKSPCGFNETRFIFFANTITSIHWVAYVPLYMSSTDHEIRAVILAFSLSLSSIVQISCLILPKLYTVLLKPEKNTRGAVMTHYKASRSYGVPETPPNSLAVTGEAVTPGPHQQQGAKGQAQQQQQQQMQQQHPGGLGVASAAAHLQLRSPHLDSPRMRITVDGTAGGRTRTWSNFHSVPNGGDPLDDDAFDSYQRARSSSVCRSTQTQADLEQDQDDERQQQRQLLLRGGPGAGQAARGRAFRRNKTVSLSVYTPTEEFRLGRLNMPTFETASFSSGSSAGGSSSGGGQGGVVTFCGRREDEQEEQEQEGEGEQATAGPSPGGEEETKAEQTRPSAEREEGENIDTDAVQG